MDKPIVPMTGAGTGTAITDLLRPSGARMD